MDTNAVTTVNVTDPAITGNTAEAPGALLPLLHRPDPGGRTGWECPYLIRLQGVSKTSGRSSGVSGNAGLAAYCGAVFAGTRYFSRRRNPPRFSRTPGRQDREGHFRYPASNTHCR